MDLRLRQRTVPPDERVVMAIVNRTPDSFYDRGATFAESAALDRVDRVVAEGAAIVDIGGVRAGPGTPVSAQEERLRTVDLVAEVRRRHPDVTISVDTWRAEVGDAACAAGADVINDAWGGADPELAAVAAERGAGLVCTHAGGQRPRSLPHRVTYDDVMADVVARTVALAERAVDLGVPAERVLVDPGHDFGKNTRHSLIATRRLGELVATGWPVLVSLSRKDFVGESLGIDDPDDRLAGTLAATAICSMLGARVFRAHDVVATRHALEMERCIAGARQPAVNRRALA